MNTTTSVVATGVIVAAGKWAREESLSVRLAVGLAAFAVGLTLLTEVDETLARQFAALVLILALFRYVPDIGRKTGLIG